MIFTIKNICKESLSYTGYSIPNRYFFRLCLSDHSSCTIRCTVTDITCRDADTRVTCVDDTTTADAEGYVIYMTISCVEDQVTGSCFGYTDLSSDTRLRTGCTRKTDTKFAEYRHGKSGTVCTVCQAGSSIHIWIADKLQCVRSDGRSISASDDIAAAIGAVSSAGRLMRRT